ncbi:hypothetical protein, partial [Phascolarctobacterium succinatutens]|uniref:hypothetical protein n=1 Tax=Phascolarctobacterium succinatutens TaxID=626940 RepID=UPI0026EE0878
GGAQTCCIQHFKNLFSFLEISLSVYSLNLSTYKVKYGKYILHIKNAYTLTRSLMREQDNQ